MIPVPTEAASIDPDFRFSTRETEHFYIHFHQGLEQTADKAVIYAEEAHSRLSEALGWEPSGKTHMVISDQSDLANGFATVLPYNLIYIYIVPPLADMSIGQYEDWLRMVITHEYAHVLTMDATRGYSSFMRSIFGKTLPGQDILSALTFLFSVPPNVLLPHWWLEGVAVWAETGYAGRGRGNSTYYDMYFRAAVAEDNLPRVDEINGEQPDWPGGRKPYIYGLALMRHISNNYGPDKIRELNMAHSGRLPYLIGRPARKEAGKKYKPLFYEAMASLRDAQEANIKAITRAGLTVPAIYPPLMESMTNPSPSPDGSMVAVRMSGPHGHGAIGIIDPESGELRKEIRVRPSDNRIAWSAGGSTIFFSEAELHRGYNLYMDLYSYDLAKNKKKRLTKGARLKEPAASGDGRVTAIRMGKESQSVVIVNTVEGTTETLKEYPGMRLSNPSWCPCGKYIVFAARGNTGRSYIMAVNIRDHSDMKLMEADHMLGFPQYTHDSNRIVYISDESGVFNVYEYDMLKKTQRRLTNLLGGALHPAVGPDGERIYFSSYTSRGFRAAYIPYPAKAVFAPRISPDWPERPDPDWPDRDNKSAIVPKTNSNAHKEAKAPLESGDRKYSALKSVLPRFWLPTLFFDHGGTGVGILTAGQDALFYHTYALSAGAGGSGKGYYLMDYRYDRLFPTLSLSASRIAREYAEFFNTGEDLFDMEESVEGRLRLPLRRLEWAAHMELGYERLRHTTLESPFEVFQGRRDNIVASIGFESARAYPYSISREEGRVISLTARDYSTDRNSHINAREYTGRYEEFMGLGSHRALYLMLAGGASKGESIAQQSFYMGGTLMDNLEYPLRGYEPGYRRGDYVAATTLELRLPLMNIQRGPGTVPLFARQLHMALFADAGAVWDEGVRFHRDMVDIGGGFELRMDTAIGYNFHATPSIGYAHGFSKTTGEDMVYIAVHVEL